MTTVVACEGDVLDVLRDIEDPEIPISIVDLGLIVSVSVVGTKACVALTFTAMGCPAMEMIVDDVRSRILLIAGISEVEVQIVWDPIWTPECVTEEGKEALREYGISI